MTAFMRSKRRCSGFYREKYWHKHLGEIVDSHKQILARFIDRLSFQEGRTFSIEMNQLIRIRFVIEFGCPESFARPWSGV